MTNENENAGKECVRMSMWAPGMILAAADAIINTTHYPHANSGISRRTIFAGLRAAPGPCTCTVFTHRRPTQFYHQFLFIFRNLCSGGGAGDRLASARVVTPGGRISN